MSNETFIQIINSPLGSSMVQSLILVYQQTSVLDLVGVQSTPNIILNHTPFVEENSMQTKTKKIIKIKYLGDI